MSVALVSVLLVGCGGSQKETSETPSKPLEVKPPDGGAAPKPAAAVMKNVSADEADELLKGSESVVVLDIRTPEEYVEGHIAGAKNIDSRSAEFATNMGKLDKDQSYLVHCRSGGRSGQSLAVFKELGFKSVYHLHRGINDWTGAGKELVK